MGFISRFRNIATIKLIAILFGSVAFLGGTSFLVWFATGGKSTTGGGNATEPPSTTPAPLVEKAKQKLQEAVGKVVTGGPAPATERETVEVPVTTPPHPPLATEEERVPATAPPQPPPVAEEERLPATAPPQPPPAPATAPPQPPPAPATAPSQPPPAPATRPPQPPPAAEEELRVPTVAAPALPPVLEEAMTPTGVPELPTVMMEEEVEPTPSPEDECEKHHGICVSSQLSHWQCPPGSAGVVIMRCGPGEKCCRLPSIQAAHILVPSLCHRHHAVCIKKENDQLNCPPNMESAPSLSCPSGHACCHLPSALRAEKSECERNGGACMVSGSANCPLDSRGQVSWSCPAGGKCCYLPHIPLNLCERRGGSCILAPKNRHPGSRNITNWPCYTQMAGLAPWPCYKGAVCCVYRKGDETMLRENKCEQRHGVCVKRKELGEQCPANSQGEGAWFCPKGTVCCVYPYVQRSTITRRNSTCGYRNAAAEGSTYRIIGGRRVYPQEMPWNVIIRDRQFVGTPTISVFCGGSIIHANWILTSAACVSQASSKNMQLDVITGFVTRRDLEENKNNPNMQRHQVKRIIVHSAFNNATMKDNIALLELATSIRVDNYSRPICLAHPDEGNLEKRVCSFAGWGRTFTRDYSTSTVAARSLHLRTVDMTIMDWRICRRVHGQYSASSSLSIDSGHLCAITSSGGTGGCAGDEGGPLACRTPTGQFIQAGITSWVEMAEAGCGSPNQPVVFTKTCRYLSWIRKKTGVVMP